MVDKQEIIKKENQLQTRSKILELENSLLELVDGVNIVKGDSEVCPLKHTFTDGIYVRQMSMKKDALAIGKIHRYKHIWFLMSGSMCVASETSSENYEAPCYVEAPAGAKRVLHAVEDCVWVNVYPNPTNTEDLDELAKLNVVFSWEEYEEYIKSKK